MATKPQMALKAGTVRGKPIFGIRKMPFVRSLSILLKPLFRRFIAGTELSEALDIVERLSKQGFMTTVDHLSSETTSRNESLKSTEQYVVMLRALKERKLEKNVSLKLSRIGLLVDKEFCLENLERIVEKADSTGGFLCIDTQLYKNADDTLDLVKRIKTSRRMPVGIVLRAVFKRTADDIVSLLNKEITIRLCKGFCREKQEIAYRKSSEVKRQFLADAKRLLTSNSYHAIATHDDDLIEELISFSKKQNISRDRFEFQMFLGIRPSLQKKLLKEGFKVRIYVPFGRSWFPYIVRRMRGGRESSWFFVKNLFRK